MHPASQKFPPVEKLSDDELVKMVAYARIRRSAMDWSPREKDALRELDRRKKATA